MEWLIEDTVKIHNKIEYNIFMLALDPDTLYVTVLK